MSFASLYIRGIWCQPLGPQDYNEIKAHSVLFLLEDCHGIYLYNLFSCLYLFIHLMRKITTNTRAVFNSNKSAMRAFIFMPKRETRAVFIRLRLLLITRQSAAEKHTKWPCRILFSLCPFLTIKCACAESGKESWISSTTASTLIHYCDLIVFVYYWRMMLQSIKAEIGQK